MAETHLEQAERHLRENAVRIERQKQLIARLESTGPEWLLTAACEFLNRLELFQELAIGHAKYLRDGSLRN